MTQEQIQDALYGYAQGHQQTTIITMWGNGEIKKQSIAMLKFSPQDDDVVLVTYTEDGYSLSRLFPHWDFDKDLSRLSIGDRIANMIDNFNQERKKKELSK
jgi:hypothetical protein